MQFPYYSKFQHKCFFFFFFFFFLLVFVVVVVKTVNNEWEDKLV